MDSVAVPGFDTVTVTGELVVFNVVGGKVTCCGETVIAGCKDVWPAVVVIVWGFIPVGKGEPLISVNAPLVGSIRYTETTSGAWFVTYANCPEGSTTTDVGPPVGNGLGSGVRAPVVESIV